MRPNISLGDTVAAIHAALGVAFAIIERTKSGKGQVVDVALYESIFNLLEGIVPEFDGAGLYGNRQAPRSPALCQPILISAPTANTS